MSDASVQGSAGGAVAEAAATDDNRYLSKHDRQPITGYLYDYPTGLSGCVGAAVASVITIDAAL